MDTRDLHRFVERTEGMVSPRDVGRLYQRAEMLARLPVAIQKVIVDRASGDDPSIGFVVEPYCFFLTYELADVAAAQRQLPPHYELVPAAIFDTTEARPCGIVGAFNIHTSVFWGSRVELYVIAEDQRSGMLSWIICDYESNTINYDPGQGFSGATTSRSVITTTHRGEVLIDVAGASGTNRLATVASLEAATMTPLEQRLWIEGNLSVDYGGRLMDPGSVPFGLVFDPDEMRQALQLPLDDVTVDENTFGASFLAPEPFEAACFPYAQHFLTSSFPTESTIRDRTDLDDAVRQVLEAE